MQVEELRARCQEAEARAAALGGQNAELASALEDSHAGAGAARRGRAAEARRSAADEQVCAPASANSSSPGDTSCCAAVGLSRVYYSIPCDPADLRWLIGGTA